MPSSDISTLGWTIADIARLNRKLADRRFGEIGMTRAQWQAMAYLQRLGPLTQAALADELEVETATIARLVDRLEAAGWVARQPDPNDRRVKIVLMTGKAQAVMQHVSEIAARLREDTLMDLTTAERDQLLGALSTVKSRLTRLLETP
jgi:DNA-binding MarR family transcriptional regulator